MKFYPLAHIFYISCPSVIPGVYCFRRGRRLQNSPHFCVFKNTRAVKQKVWNEAENREWKARALRAHETLTSRFSDFFTDFEKKKPTVLQSIVKVARYHFLQIKCSAARASGFSRVEGGGGDRKGAEEKQAVPQRLFLSPTPKKFPIYHFILWLQ